jgi:phosphatidylinositol alpha-1,6-mannosyltransferase
MVPKIPGCEALDSRLPFPVHRIPSTYDTFPVKSIPPLWRLVQTERVDTVFHAQWQTLITSLTVRRGTGSPKQIFAAAHGRELLLNPVRSVPLLGSGFDRLRRGILHRVDRFFPVSRYTASLLQKDGVSSQQIDVVKNGTDPERFHPVDATGIRRSLGIDDRPVLLTVGRLVRRKGIDTVLEALPGVLRRVPEAVYVIAGDGPDRERLESLARELNVYEHTRFAGRVPHDDLNDYYNACDVFVLTARTVPPSVEGFGIVFLEANACEKPVIGSRSGGIPDAIADGKTGYIIDPGATNQLVEKAAYLLNHPEIAREMGRHGRRRILDSLTWKHVAERLYDQMC